MTREATFKTSRISVMIDWNLCPKTAFFCESPNLKIPKFVNSYSSGQIIATSHDLTPHGRVVGEPCLKWPYFREIQVGEIL